MQQGSNFREDVAWAAGLFEGEGCFTICHSSKQRGSAQAVLTMTDRDIVERFASVMGIGQFYFSDRNPGKHKPQTKWVVSTFEGVQAVVAMLWPWLGPRRRQRALEVLAWGRVNRHNGAKTHCKHGHEFTEENTYIFRLSGGSLGRQCRACHKAQSLAYRRRLASTA